MKILAWIGGGLAAIALVALMLFNYVSGSYNDFVTGDQLVRRTAAEIQTSYQRRTDLIPNIVKTVETEANFERSTLTDVINARSKVAQLNVNATDLADNRQMQKQFYEAQQALSGSLSRLMVVVEKYPDLKSNAAFKDLRVTLEGTENRIKTARDDNQKAVEKYNVQINYFVKGMVASRYGFKEKPYYTASDAAQTAPSVDINIGKKS